MPFLEISRARPAAVAWTDNEPEPLKINAVRVRIDRFGVSANNITYVALACEGTRFGYAKFFPTGAPDKTIHMPVWGYATVTHSNHSKVLVGTRIYGYYPAGSSCDLVPNTITDNGFIVSRPQLPAEYAAYNSYIFAATDPFYLPRYENATIVFRPLWSTSFLLQDYLEKNNLFGASTVVISSASAKTSFCLAHLLHLKGIRCIGLTSKGNQAWTRRLGVYTDIVLYSDLEAQLACHTKGDGIVFVDIAGDTSIRRRVFAASSAGGNAAAVRKSVGVGMAHFNPDEPPAAGAKVRDAVETEVFFAPAWYQVRARELGPEELQRRMLKSWFAMLSRVDQWMQFKEVRGAEEAKKVYLEFLAGKADAKIGVLASIPGGEIGSKVSKL
ncbi:hypothetical protein BC830DRAFT_1106076 [Chytriomyces sp. MP71]|nr:hypothetical protein BC830DRAFT_1106076 [Chytriomyces sp. MP71]